METTNYFNPNKNVTYKWNSTIINKILRDTIYVGDLVQFKKRKINYKIKKFQKVPKDMQIIIKNNHQPIVDRKIF